MAMLFFGGSFNPIHVGHLICARHAAEQIKADATVLVPSAQPPHKPNATDLAPAVHRVRMCQIATHASESFDVDDLETKRTGPSYTIDTVRELARRGVGRVSWLIGADMLRNLPTWREPQALMEEAQLVVMARPGWSFDWETLPPPFRKLRDSVVEAPLIQVSATQIRRRIQLGLPIDFLTPAPVVQYIRDNGLYH
jgi:nicotinate-nucleotide adenylyltransferase